MQVDKGANFIHRAWLGGFFAQCRQLGADLSESFIEPAQFPRNVAFAHRVLGNFERYMGIQMRPSKRPLIMLAFKVLCLAGFSIDYYGRHFL